MAQIRLDINPFSTNVPLQQPLVFSCFQGGIEVEHWMNMGQANYVSVPRTPV